MAAADESSVLARVPLARGARMHFSWGPGAELRLCEIQNPTTGLGGNEPVKSTVVWSAPTSAHKALAFAVAPLQSELSRANAAAANGVGMGSAPRDGVTPQLLAFSQGVRKCLEKERTSAPEGEELIAVEAAVWHLLDTFLLGTARSEGFIAEDLASWLSANGAVIDRLSGRQPLEARVEALKAAGRPDIMPDYWPCLVHLVAVGRVREALGLMDAHDLISGAGAQVAAGQVLPQYEVLDALYVVLRQMPRFKQAAAAGGGADVSGPRGPTGREFDNMAEYMAYRSSWQAQCGALPQQCADLFAAATAASPRTVEGVQSVLRVLRGDVHPASTPLNNWLELTVAQLTHVRPNAKASQHLPALLDACRGELPEEDAEGGAVVLGLMHGLIQALCSTDVQGVIEVLSTSGLVSPWFMAHAYDLLRAAPGGRGVAGAVVERPLPLFGGDQAEYWRLLFAETLQSSPSAVRLVVEYLAWCPVHGEGAAAAFLEGLQVASSQAQDGRLLPRVLAVCNRHGLTATAAHLVRLAGVAAWYDGRTGTAASLLAAAAAYGGGGSISGGGGDARRLTVVLEPLVARAAGALSGCVGNYTVSPLPDLAGQELPLLLAALPGTSGSSTSGASGIEAAAPGWLQPGSRQQQADASSSGSSGARDHPSVALLRGYVALQQAAAAVQQAQEASDAGALSAAYAALRSAAMQLLAAPGGSAGSRCVVPRPLVLPLLCYLLPFLESPGAAGAFSVADVQAMIGLLSSLTSNHGITSALAATPTASQQQQAAAGSKLDAAAAAMAAAQATLHERHVKDVRLALARALARAHAYSCQQQQAAAAVAPQQNQSQQAAVGRGAQVPLLAL